MGWRLIFVVFCYILRTVFSVSRDLFLFCFHSVFSRYIFSKRGIFCFQFFFHFWLFFFCVFFLFFFPLKVKKLKLTYPQNKKYHRNYRNKTFIIWQITKARANISRKRLLLFFTKFGFTKNSYHLVLTISSKG